MLMMMMMIMYGGGGGHYDRWRVANSLRVPLPGQWGWCQQVTRWWWRSIFLRLRNKASCLSPDPPSIDARVLKRRMQIVKVSAAVKERSNKKLKGQMTHFGGAKQFNLYQLLLWCSKKFWAVYLLLIIVLSLTNRFARPTCYQISNRSTCVILCWSDSR